MKYQDLFPGLNVALGPVRIEAAEMIAFSRRYDSHWIHTDPMRAEIGSWSGLIASPWHTCALAVELANAFLAGPGAHNSPSFGAIRWPNPVRPNDLLTLHLTVEEIFVPLSEPDCGIVRWQWSMTNQQSDTVLTAELTNRFDVCALPHAALRPVTPQHGHINRRGSHGEFSSVE